MPRSVSAALDLDPTLAQALENRGFTSLTQVQAKVLDPALRGRDLRISSQTGSGKTVAIGLILRDAVVANADAGTPEGPRALVVAPTRELAKQVEEELAWLYAPLQQRVVSVTGGSNYRDERRALASGAAIVVGTPGRLLDHLRRGAIATGRLGAIVLDEADRMLDLGFREDLEAILGFAPEGHATHLVSATFPREVRALADRVQKSPVNVEGSPLGVANADIEHVLHLVAHAQRFDALVNLLLESLDTPTLIFARTRADVAALTRALDDAGFRTSSLSGEMEQRARDRALAAFKRGGLHALVATDVAARGIDVVVGRVIHAEPPTDADTYTHRSGRTGRAGRKGTSVVLAEPTAFGKTSALLRRAGVPFRVEPIPTAEAIRTSRDERLFEELTRDDVDAALPVDEAAANLARRCVEAGRATEALTRLLVRARQDAPCEPREVTPIAAPARERRAHERAPRERAAAAPASGEHFRRNAPPRDGRADGWVPFRISWGVATGADTRRLLAMVCRRGGIRGADVGAIVVDRSHSIVEVASSVAKQFDAASGQPDPRDPRITIRRASEEEARPRDAQPARARPLRRKPDGAFRGDSTSAPHGPRAAPRPPKSRPRSVPASGPPASAGEHPIRARSRRAR